MVTDLCHLPFIHLHVYPVISSFYITYITPGINFHNINPFLIHGWNNKLFIYMHCKIKQRSRYTSDWYKLYILYLFLCFMALKPRCITNQRHKYEILAKKTF